MTSKEPSKQFFVRPASGLVREVSTVRASFFNLAGSVGNGPAISVAYVCLFPTVLLFGLPTFSWALTVGAVPFALCYLLCLAILTHSMPRTGGDYVYTSRITNSFLGWLEGWTLIWAAAGVIGYNGWATVYNVGGWLKAGTVVSSAWLEMGNWVNQTDTMLALGIVMLFIVALINMAPTRLYHTIVSLMCGISVVMVFVALIPMVGLTSETFAANFVKYTGMTQQQVIDTAVKNGFTPSWFSWIGIEAVFGFSIFAYQGYTFSTYLAGELKGNIQKNVIVSTLIALLFPLFTGAYYILPYFSIGGYDFLNCWGYLFWNYPDLAPLKAPPLTTILAAIGNPSAAGLTLLAGFPVLVFFNFLVLLCWSTSPVRVLFAQTMDRMYPKKLAEVNARTHQPLYAIALMMLIGYIFYVVSILGYSPAATLWYSVTLGMLTFLFPAVNCIVLKWRRPDIFEIAPAWARKRVAGLPVMVWLGIVWLAFLIPVFTVADLWPIISGFLGLAPQALLSYVFGTGLLLTVFLLVVGIVWYFAAKYYNEKRGIELGMVFKAIPPE
jgi:APA family basic amino acid/polyamine antiporter